MQSYEVRDLILRCAEVRDREVWQQFIDRFGRRLWSGVRRTLQRFDARLSEDEHQDLVQEVYCRLLDRQGRYLRRCRAGDEGEVSAYLRKVTESVVVDHLRSRNAQKRGRQTMLEVHPDLETDPLQLAVDSRLSPEERCLLREERTSLLVRCRDLVSRRSPERDLAVLYLALFEGFTSREICRRLGRELTPSTVDSLVHRFRKRLSGEGVEIPRRRSGPVLLRDAWE